MADDGREASGASRKRPSPSSDDEMDDAPRPAPPPPALSNLKLHEPHKLRRLQEQHDRMLEDADKQQQQQTSKTDSDYNVARDGLRQALVLALDHVGFSSATDDALESFLLMTESYFHSMAKDVARFALAGRRSQAIPLDFESALPRFNIGTGALRPHLKNPVAKSKLAPQCTKPDPASTATTAKPAAIDGGDLPLLSKELSGRPEKVGKTYIPAGFPDFPSIHTYRHTPVDVDKVTVVGSGLRYDDGSLLLLPNEEASADDRELGLGATGTAGSAAVGRGTNGVNNDPKRIREAAAVEAKQAEEALRGLMRASKVNKLKEVRAAANRNRLNKQRYTLWETAMRELIVETNGGKLPAAATASVSVEMSPSRKNAAAATALREEIADQSMMVNSEKVFHRKEIPRKARRVL